MSQTKNDSVENNKTLAQKNATQKSFQEEKFGRQKIEKIDQKIRELEKSKSPSVFKNKMFLTVLVSGFITLVISLAGLGAVLIWPEKNNFNQVEEPELTETISFKNVEQKVIQELQNSLVYTSSDQEERVVSYYSPSLDVLIEYPAEKYSATEDIRGVLLNLEEQQTASFGNFARMTEVEKSDINNSINKYLKNNYSFLDNLKVIDESKGEVNKLHLQFSQTNFLNDEIEQRNRVLYSRELPDSYLVVEFLFNDKIELSEYEDSLIAILETADPDPQTLKQQIEIVLDSTGLSFSFDRDKWDTGVISPISASLTFRSEEHENTEVELPLTSLNISTRFSSQGTGPEALEEYFNNIVQPSIEAAFGDNNFGSGEITQETKSGVDFLVYKYSYDNFDGSRKFASLYLGALNDHQIIVTTIRTKGENTAGLEEGLKVLDNLKIPAQSNEANQTSKESEREVLGITSTEVDTAAIIGQPAVVHILNRTCLDIQFLIDKNIPTLSGNSYEVCTADLGSGFFVNKDGYVITNSHVATPNEIDVVYNSINYIRNNAEIAEFWNDLLTDTSKELINQGQSAISLSDQERAAAGIGLFIAAFENNVAQVTPNYENYIEKDRPFEVNIFNLNLVSPSSYYGTDVLDTRGNDSLVKIAANQAIGQPDGVSTPDLALLKINNANGQEFPILNLADPETVSIGTEISTIGFPNTANNRTLFASDRPSIPTIAQGNLRAKKPSFDNSFELVQIDASISPENSGGPIVNNLGSVVGVSTYGINANAQGNADFNFGVFVEEVFSLMGENSVASEQGDYNKYLQQGLSDFSKKYYEWSKINLENAIQEYPPAKELLSPIIRVAELNIEAGLSVTPTGANMEATLLETISNSVPVNVAANRWIIVGAFASLIIISIMVIILIVAISNSRKRSHEKDTLAKLQAMYQQRQRASQVYYMAPGYPNQTANSNYPQQHSQQQFPQNPNYPNQGSY